MCEGGSGREPATRHLQGEGRIVRTQPSTKSTAGGGLLTHCGCPGSHKSLSPVCCFPHADGTVDTDSHQTRIGRRPLARRCALDPLVQGAPGPSGNPQPPEPLFFRLRGGVRPGPPSYVYFLPDLGFLKMTGGLACRIHFLNGLPYLHELLQRSLCNMPAGKPTAGTSDTTCA